MRVLLTGAAGRVGGAVLDHLGDEYEWTLSDREETPGDGAGVDIVRRPAVRRLVDGHDAVVHLAADPSVQAPWDSVLRNNVVGHHTVLDAASEAGVDRFVFASTNHVVAGWEDEHGAALRSGELIFDHTTPPRPDSLYGASKAFGESLGRYYVDQADAPSRFYALRIGGLHTREHDHPWDNERGRAWWLSRRDCAHLVDRCLSANGPAFGVFYGVSDNRGRWCDLDYARQAIGYRPRDDAAETGPPGD
jgi:NAD+ dependent glucose-6-phosphate dehydrogenase